MFDQAQGVLAIWNDIRAGETEAFEAWYKTEHFPERLAVPGFRLGRRYEALAGAPRYFCFYLTDTPDVLAAPAYLARLNDPTPRTRAVMTQGFVNMCRTACRRVATFGRLRGALGVTVRFDRPPDPARAVPMLERLASEDGIARAEFWMSAEAGGAAAAEERLRGGDKKIAACILVDALRETDAARAGDALRAAFGDSVEIGVYRLLCEIARSDGA